MIALYAKKVDMDLDLIESKVNSFVRVGGAWIEIIRLLLSEKFNLVVCNKNDPIGECKNIIDILVKDMESSSMYNTADAGGLDEFTDALDAISKKIDNGYYENAGKYARTNANTSKSLTDTTKDDGKIEIGNAVDVYREDLGIWYAATIIGIESRPSTTDNDNVIETYVKVRYNGWGIDPRHEEVINILSNRISPLGTKIDDILLRYQPPESSTEPTQPVTVTDTSPAKTWPCPYCTKIYNSYPGWRYHVEENKCRIIEEEKAPMVDRPLGHSAIYDDVKAILINYGKRYRYYYHQCYRYY